MGLKAPLNGMRPSLHMTRIPVFFSHQLIAPDQSASPSAHKPAIVVADWLKHSFPIEVSEPHPVTRDQLTLAHDAQFVDDVLGLQRNNGFGNCSADVAASLPYTTGSMLAAAREALVNGRVAVAPVSGFHHACHDRAGGFCTFNGLMVTACVLYMEGLLDRIGILDFDQHYGNGTDNIITALGVQWVHHITAGAHWRYMSQASEFLDAIPKMVDQMRRCDLILYQAGADPHINDPFGGWLTTDQLYDRDMRVFNAATKCGVPLAWNLAGGYQRTADGGIEPVLQIHRNTMLACLRTYSEI